VNVDVWLGEQPQKCLRLRKKVRSVMMVYGYFDACMYVNVNVHATVNVNVNVNVNVYAYVCVCECVSECLYVS